MKLSIRHLTRYRYDRSVRFSDHLLLLRPIETHLLAVESFVVETRPATRSRRWVRDVFNNIVLAISFGEEESNVLEFDCRIALTSQEKNPFNFILEDHAVRYPFAYHGAERSVLAPYVVVSIPGSAGVPNWLWGLAPELVGGGETVSLLCEINRRVGQAIAYQRRDEEGVQTPEETIRLGRGSCRDMALLFIAICRSYGLAARFVSGYFYDPPAVPGGTGTNRAEGSMHAWAEVYLPGAGWKGFDPTNGVLADYRFIPTAVGLEPADVSPMQGHFIGPAGGSSELEVDLEIARA
jgi:transglutaminase-like putative cysteine protease